jgi:hypothetical protein
MKINAVLLGVVILLVVPFSISCNRITCVDPDIHIDGIQVKEHMMTIEEVDGGGTMYRIDITSSKEIEDWATLDYNIKVKLQNVSLLESDRNLVLNIIRKECPEDITSITVQFE